MEEKKEQKYEKWLDDQSVEIPVRKFRKMIRKIDKLHQLLSESYSERYKLRNELDNRIKELDEAKNVIAGYKETMMQGLGIKEDDKLADLQFEKGVSNEQSK